MTKDGYKLKTQYIDVLIQDSGLASLSLKILCWVGERVQNGNKVTFDTKDICNKFLVEKSSVSKALKELEENYFIKTESQNGSIRIVAVNPVYFYRGDYGLQPKMIKEWYKEVSKGWNSVIKQTNDYLNKV